MKKFKIATFTILLLFAGCIGPNDIEEFCIIEENIATETILLEPSDDNMYYTANIQVADITGDGDYEIIVTEPSGGLLTILDECEELCIEYNLSQGLIEPLRASPHDMNQDGILDLVVADIGSVWPSLAMVGRVVILYGESNGTVIDYRPEVVLEEVGRVTCAEVADLDNDGDLDIIVCEFGHFTGSITWLEQNDTGSFIPHQLDNRAGTIHAFPHDADGDGDIDIAAVISQTSEEVVLFRNNNSSFEKEELFVAGFDYFGMTGLSIADIEGDGDIDLLFTNGAQWDGDTPYGVDLNELHGLRLLRNDGEGNYSLEKITNLFGAYGTAIMDADDDGDLDIFIGTHQMNKQYPRAENISLLFLEQQENGNFERFMIDDVPTGLMTISPGYEGVGLLLVGSYMPNEGEQATRLSALNFKDMEICS